MGAATLSTARYRAIVEELITRSHDREAMVPKNARQLVNLATLEMEAVQTAEGVLSLIDAGLGGIAEPLVRKVFEFGIVAQWIYVNREGIEAYFALGDRSHHLLLKELQAANMAMPDEIRKLMSSTSERLPPEAETLRRFERVCASFGKEAGLYVMYRHLSSSCHPSPAGGWRWMTPDPQSVIGLSFRRPPPPVLSLLLYPLAAGLLWCARPVDEQTKHKPRRQALRALSKEMGISSLLKPTGG